MVRCIVVHQHLRESAVYERADPVFVSILHYNVVQNSRSNDVVGTLHRRMYMIARRIHTYGVRRHLAGLRKGCSQTLCQECASTPSTVHA